jgi:hypothetical protein
MKFVYLKSMDSYINFDHVAIVEFSRVDGKERAMICFASSDSQMGNEHVFSPIDDEKDVSALRFFLDEVTELL